MANDPPDGNVDDDDTTVDAAAAAAADDDVPAGTCAAASDAAVDRCRNGDADDDNDGDDDCDDGESGDDDDDDSEDIGTNVGDEDANVAETVVLLSVETVVAEDGREPLPLLIRALLPRGLLALLLLSKQVRGPVREVEESEYDWEEDP